MTLTSGETEDLATLDPIQRRLLPIADLFMGLMLSRPGGLSLRSTRVTSVTIGLAIGLALAAGVPGLVLLPVAIVKLQPPLIGMAAAAAGLGLGAACLAVFGLRQRSR